jgi:hypothetical protein
LATCTGRYYYLPYLAQEENYLTDAHYEQERFTDAYNEYFEVDENKADRFTDDVYREKFTD